MPGQHGYNLVEDHIMVQSPWPTREAVKLYQEKLAHHNQPEEYRERMRRVAEHNAMLELDDGTYEGVQGADAANNYRLLARECGARPLHELRPEAAQYCKKLQREHYMQQVLFSVLIETVERCASKQKGYSAFAPR